MPIVVLVVEYIAVLDLGLVVVLIVVFSLVKVGFGIDGFGVAIVDFWFASGSMAGA